MSSFSPQSFLAGAFSAASFFIEQFTPDVTRGGVADYRHYRKRLKKIADAADRRLYGKVEKKIAAIVAAAPVEIKQQAQAVQSAIDFSELVKHQTQENHVLLVNSLKKLDQLLEAAMIRQQNEEEELIIMMLLA